MQQNIKHFVFVVGTRAQLIKIAPVIVQCEKRDLPCTLLMTGQHLETMQDLLDEFGVRSKQVYATSAKEHATVMSLFSWLPKAYFGVVRQLKKLKTTAGDLSVLVHGDTLSTVLGALAGRRAGARIVHLESGLTSNRLFDPFPEEISRRIVFRLSHVAMCPCQEAMHHMQSNYPRCTAVDTGGNTILDAVKLTGIGRSTRNSGEQYIVASLHRFQNIYESQRLFQLVELLKNISQSHAIYFVMHPATRKRLVKSELFDDLASQANIKLLPRLGYSEFLRLAAGAACVLTDGGSNQEELAALGVPTIVMRQTTERSDGLGENVLLEADLPNDALKFFTQKEYLSLDRAGERSFSSSPSELIMNYLSASR